MEHGMGKDNSKGQYKSEGKTNNEYGGDKGKV